MDEGPIPLPRGRHHLSREQVRASQRERLLLAMEELVGDEGYDRVSVPQVVKAARVTSRTFYEFFDTKADCFLELSRIRGTDLLELIGFYAEAIAATEDPHATFTQGVEVYLSWWQARPREARAYFIDLPMVGEPAWVLRDTRHDKFAKALGSAAQVLRDRLGLRGELRDVDASAAVLAALELVGHCVRSGRSDQIGQLREDLVRVFERLLLFDERR